MTALRLSYQPYDVTRLGHGQQVALRAAESVVGRCEVVSDLSWDLDLSNVLVLRPTDGEAVVAKRHVDAGQFGRELHAYRRWVPAIADRAPRLLGVAEDECVLVMSLLPGRLAQHLQLDTAETVHRDAGVVLRRFHDAQPAVPHPAWAEDREARLREWLADAPEGLLDPNDIAWAFGEARALRTLPAPAVVPCHGDWQPRNWLIDADLLVRTFDFEHARLSWWIHDLQRLVWQEWASVPSLAVAFLEGYGRGLTEDEVCGLWSSTAIGHIIQIVWASRHGDTGYAAKGREHLQEMRLPGGRDRFFERLSSY